MSLVSYHRKIIIWALIFALGVVLHSLGLRAIGGFVILALFLSGFLHGLGQFSSAAIRGELRHPFR
jgi:hypothetical protein